MARSLQHWHAVAVITSIVKYLVLALALLLLVVVMASLWLTGTSSGSRWAWNQAVPLVPGSLGASSVTGSIRDGFQLTGVSYISEGMEVEVARASIAARFILFPLSIDVRHLQAESIIVNLKDTGSPDDAQGFKPETLRLPFELNIEDASVRDLSVRSAAGDRIFALRSADFAGQWHHEIALSRLTLDSDTVNLDGAVRLSLARPHAVNLSMDAVIPVNAGNNGTHLFKLTATGDGSLAEMQVDVTSQEPAVRITGRVLDLIETPAWDLRMQTSYIQWPLRDDPAAPPQAHLRNTDLRTVGDLSDYSLAGTGEVSSAGVGEHTFRLESDGSQEGLHISELELLGDLLAASAVGELRWSGGFAIAADMEVERFDPAVLTDAWPAAQPVSGTVDAGWSAGHLLLNEVKLRVQDAPTRVDASGEINLDGGIVDLDLDWSDLRWPMAEPQEAGPGQLPATRDASGGTRLASEFGRVNVTGTPQNWQFEGRAAFRADDLPQGVFVVSGSGNRDQVEAKIQPSEILGGSVSGSASYNWTEAGRWTAELETDDLDISPLVSQLPGRVSADFSTRGQVVPLQFVVDISRLEGTLRDRPVSGAGGLRYADGNFNARQLQIILADSSLQADGSLESEAGLTFSIDIDSIAGFYPAVAGAVEAKGNLSLASEFPSLQLDLQARDVFWEGNSLSALHVTSTARQGDLPLLLEASATDIALGTREIQEIAAQLEAGPERQRLQAEISVQERAASVELDGALEDWRDPLESAWAGDLRSLQFAASEENGFALLEPAGLQLARSQVSLERACFSGNEEGRLCAEGSWGGGSNFSADAEMDALPVSLVNLFFDTSLEFTQTLSGALVVASDSDLALTGEGQIDISPGRVQNSLDARLATQTGPGELSFSVAGGQLLAGRLVLPFSESGEIDGYFEAADIGQGADSPVDGQLTIDLNDIAVAANIAPMIEEAHGRLNVDLAIAGTLGSPLFTGEATLREGAFRYAPLGLNITDIQLQSQISEDNRIELQSAFRAGEGTGELQSRTASLGGIREGLELSLTGEDLTLIDLPDAKVVANPDLYVALRDQGLVINGNILIPRAWLTPVNLTAEGKVGESEDVIIVQNGGEETTASNGNGAPFEMHGTVALVLGDDVVVDLDVAEARVQGSSAFRWDGPLMPVASGQYNIEGRFEAYGQLLDITEGTVSFPGVPASEPNLRIRAEREIFGNPQIRTAGVLVTGTPQNPEVEVYTNPATSRDRALTLLVTGSDFNYEQGVGAVDVGTYIAPDFYVSYGIGLFERGNVISVRYDIAKGFGIKATSGRNADGVDLSYTLER